LFVGITSSDGFASRIVSSPLFIKRSFKSTNPFRSMPTQRTVRPCDRCTRRRDPSRLPSRYSP